MKHFGKKALSVFLSLVMTFSVFAILGAPITASAAAEVSNPRQGGVQVIFTNSTTATQTNIDFVDPSSSNTYYIRFINRSTHTATITGFNNSSYVDGTVVGQTIASGGSLTFAIKKEQFGTTDGSIWNFCISYTLDNVYGADGETLYRFNQAAYIGSWYTSDDSKAISDVRNGQYGFTIVHGNCNVTSRFMTDRGILESASLSGDGSTNITFTYNYWIDTTGLSAANESSYSSQPNAKTWEALGFRMFAQKWSSNRHHLQPSGQNVGTLTLGGNYSAIGSMSMADLVTSYSAATDGFNYPASNRPWANSSRNYCTPFWDGQTQTRYGTLYNNSGESCYFRFCGALPTPGTSSANPFTVTFTNILWRNPMSGGGNGYFSGTINCYVFDKTTLSNYVRSMAGLADFAPLSGRYTSSAWNAYNSALQTAMTVLANQKTNQKAVTDAYNALVSAVNNLNVTSNMTQVVYVNHVLFNGEVDPMAIAGDHNDSRYIMTGVNSGTYTVPYLAAFNGMYNKRTAVSAKTYNSSTTGSLDNVTVTYWNIDLSNIQNAVDRANAIINADYCYSEDYKNSLKAKRDELIGYAEVNTATPLYQSSVNSAITAIETLETAKNDDSNHSHVADDWEITAEATCTTTGTKVQYCKYCHTRMATETIPATGHSYGAWSSNNDGTHSRVCSVCSDVDTVSCTATYVNITVDPTCTVGGYDNHTCSVCGYSYQDNYTDATGHSWNAGEVTTPATCTATGVKTFTCTVCDEIRTEDIPMLDHDYDTNGDGTVTAEDGVVTTQPTCTEKGVRTYTCKTCGGASYTEDIPANGHSYTAVVTDPTCTEKGYTTYTCSVCGNNYKADYTDALGHDYASSVTTEPTCTEKGVKTYTCTRCGDFYTEDIDPLGHDYVAAVTDPTCLDQGYTTYTCSRCGDSYVDDYTDALGHDFVDSDIAFDADCTNDGVMNQKCSRCDATTTRVIPAKGHTWGSIKEQVSPTCTTTGLMAAKCEVCGLVDSGIEIPALGHDIVIDVEYKAETCTEDGRTEGHHCSRCSDETVDSEVIPAKGHSPYVSKAAQAATCTADGWTQEVKCRHDASEILEASTLIPALGHDYVDSVTDPTCTTDGYTTHTCSRCDDSYTDTIVPKLGHDWGDPISVTPATCTTDGKEVYECSRCHEQKTEVLTATGHSWNEGVVTKTPTCTETGAIEYTCTVCGYVNSVVLAPKGHTYNITVTPPTCMTDGFTTHSCVVCGYSYESDKIPATGHNFDITVTAPTCTDQGYTTYRCTLCGYTYKDDYTSPTGHTYDEYVVAATCTEQGYTSYTCVVCGHTYTGDYVAPLGHDYIEYEVAPTCSEQGYTYHGCSRCDSSYKDNYTDPLGHHFIETDRVSATKTKSGYILYTCDRCGYEYKEVLYVGGKALVCETLYDANGKPVKQATIYVTNLDTDETFVMSTDLNGYFTYVFPVGNWELKIHKDLYSDAIGTIIVEDGKADVNLPIMQTNPCDCLCHQDNVWAKLFRVILKLLKLFGYDSQCCADSDLWL